MAHWLSSLEDAGPLTVAADGREALAVLAVAGEVPGLVLLDLELPLVHGMDVLRYLRSEPRFRRTVVVVTGSTGDPGRDRTGFLPGEVWMPKPFGPDDLELAIRLARARITPVQSGPLRPSPLAEPPADVR